PPATSRWSPTPVTWHSSSRRPPKPCRPRARPAHPPTACADLERQVAIGVAVLKYRLYEIDVVISKAVLYGSLAVFITAVYAGLVVGVGTLAGGRDSPLGAALAAAGGGGAVHA